VESERDEAHIGHYSRIFAEKVSVFVEDFERLMIIYWSKGLLRQIHSRGSGAVRGRREASSAVGEIWTVAGKGDRGVP
jgi:hypothetical protein